MRRKITEEEFEFLDQALRCRKMFRNDILQYPSELVNRLVGDGMIKLGKSGIEIEAEITEDGIGSRSDYLNPPIKEVHKEEKIGNKVINSLWFKILLPILGLIIALLELALQWGKK
jgi:hypothetical protein